MVPEPNLVSAGWKVSESPARPDMNAASHVPDVGEDKTADFVSEPFGILNPAKLTIASLVVSVHAKQELEATTLLWLIGISPA